MADTDEAPGEDVQQEAAGELSEGEREGPTPATAVVLVAERHGLVVDVEQAMVRDGDAVGVAGQVGDHELGALEGWLGVDDPLGSARLVKIAAERRRTSVAREAAVQLDASFLERVVEGRHELAAEQPAQHANGQEEAGPACLPRAAVLGQSSSRHHTVYMRMMDERLAPGM